MAQTRCVWGGSPRQGESPGRPKLPISGPGWAGGACVEVAEWDLQCFGALDRVLSQATYVPRNSRASPSPQERPGTQSPEPASTKPQPGAAVPPSTCEPQVDKP